MHIWAPCIFWFLGLLLLQDPATALAQADQSNPTASDAGYETLYGDEEFISIASGMRKPVYKAPAVASLITAEDIRAMGARNLNEILETVPGLHVGLSSLNRLDSVFSIRGIHTGNNPQVLILMNGIPFPFLYTGAHPTLFRLPVSSIARVEVIRGPGSAVYGADAYAGVINIITKEASDIRSTEVGGRAGSFDSQDLWFQHGATHGGLDLALTFESQHSDDDRSRRVSSDFQSTLDQAYGTTASLAPGPLSTRYDVIDTHLEIKKDSWKLRNWYWRLDDAGQGAGGAQALDPEGSQNVDLYLADLSYDNNKLSRNWGLHANLSYLYQNNDASFQLLPPGTLVPLGVDGNLNFTAPTGLYSFPNGLRGAPGGTDQQTSLDISCTYTGVERHKFRIGSGFKYQKEETFETKNFGPGVTPGNLTDVTATPYVFMPDTTRRVWYLSLQDEWQLGRDWELTAGLRHDNYSDFGGTFNPRLALVWAARHNLTTKILYGRAFRAPSFAEQFAINNPVVLGNPNLKPETIDTYEIAFDYRPTFELKTGLSLFAYQAEDLIEFVPDANGSSNTAQNARNQKGYGLELEAGWKAAEKLQIGGNYAFQYSVDRGTGKRIADAPGMQALVWADWKFQPNWSMHPEVHWVGLRKRASGDYRKSVENFALVNLCLRRKNILTHWDLALNLRNLFDADAREPSNGTIPYDYPLEGRSFWGELSYRF